MESGTKVDVVLVGGGIMSATVAALLHELQPRLSIHVFERLDAVALESTEAMNNAGTGHAANCELNYTPETPGGDVDITKALSINGAFELSMQFWSHLVEQGRLPHPRSFVHPVPHISFVWGEDSVRFLRVRHERLRVHPMFQDMSYTEDRAELTAWMPLVTEHREKHVPCAATRVQRGTDLNFAHLARALFGGLEGQDGFRLHVRHEVQDLQREPDGRWRVRVKDLVGKGTREVSAGFVFLGAGGGTLPLLLKAGIPESRGYGGVPVSGQWLVCTRPDLLTRHQAKVYGKASLGAPPMSVPHLDTRMIDGKPALLFGPFAGFTTKFLKHGSYLDMPMAFRTHNLWPMTGAAWHNRDLTRYLIGQALQSHEDRVEALRAYYPDARPEDWQLAIAGQRVQIVKRDLKGWGRLEFGTEVVSAADGSLAALLGASPGASTAVHTMSAMLLACFQERAHTEDWPRRLRTLLPSFGQNLSDHPDLLRTTRARCNGVLGLG